MVNSVDLQGRLALDAHGLDALRLQAKQDPTKALRGAAQQFEAVFLQTLLKSMRDASPQDGPFDSDETRTYTAMLDQQLAQSLSARGIGLADAMLRQLSRNAGVPAPAETQAPAPVSSAAPPKAGQLAGQFVQDMKAYAADASRATGIPAGFLVAQAALETGWGRREIRAADGTPSYNLFGIKAGRGWSGPTVDALTTEYVNGTPQRVVQKFRAYGSYAEAFQDYASMLRSNPRYASLLGQQDGASFASGLQRAGYATDPRYGEKLQHILSGPDISA